MNNSKQDIFVLRLPWSPQTSKRKLEDVDSLQKVIAALGGWDVETYRGWIRTRILSYMYMY